MRTAQRQHSHPALLDAIDDVFNAKIGDVSGRGKLAADMREIWTMQTRFEKRTGSAPFGLVEQPRFRAAFDFMRLRADAGEVDEVLADWWQTFTMADDATRQALVEQARTEQQKRARVARSPRQPAADANPKIFATDATEALHAADNSASNSATRKRRRRRTVKAKSPDNDSPFNARESDA
jgi:poly(A) polymerase